MVDKFKPEKTEQATEEELDEIAVIRNRDWQKAIATADRTIKPYLQAPIDNGSINSR